MDNFTIEKDFTLYINLFKEENSKLNLISKNDENFLFEKHIYDSLAIKLFFDKYNIKHANILDIGCGGGFPSVPIAIEFPDMNITGIDSIRKKINADINLKEKLGLANLNFICDRVENIKDKKYDIVVSRAVADLSIITAYAVPLLKNDGYFIAYKSKKYPEELKNAEKIFKKLNVILIDNISYTLPLKEAYERNLLIIRFAD